MMREGALAPQLLIYALIIYAVVSLPLTLLTQPAQADWDWMADEYRLNARLCILQAVNVYRNPLGNPVSRETILRGVSKICARVFVIWSDYIGMDRSQANLLFIQAMNDAIDGREPLE
jgi:hypothetical protein